MVSLAVTKEGKPVYPEQYSDADWLHLKETYLVGDILTVCCSSPAVPKTSINGTKFFAHLTDECSTSPEAKWHLETKSRIVDDLRGMGIDAILEQTINGVPGRLKSDVYFECHGRRIAIEVQHSYQTFREFLRRQEKYSSLEVENYWILYKPCYLTVSKSITRLRLKREFGGKCPPEVFWACIPELPLVLYDPEIEGGLVSVGAPLKASLSTWLNSIIGCSFRYVDGAWRIG